MIFKVIFRFNGETWWRYYKALDIACVCRFLLKDSVTAIQVFKIKRLLRLPKGVEPIEL